MGFLWQEEKTESKPAASQANYATKKSRKAFSKDEVGCDACPLRETWGRLLAPKMPLYGDKNAEILIISDLITHEDDQAGHIFSRKEDHTWLKKLPMVAHGACAYQGVYKCAAEPIGDPRARRLRDAVAAHACTPFLDEDIASMPNLKAILLLGDEALARFWPGAQMNEQHGIAFPIKNGDRCVWGYPVFSPGYVASWAKKWGEGPAKPVADADIRRFFREYHKWPPAQVFDLKPEMVQLCYTEAETRAAIADMIAAGEPIGLDLESTGLSPFEVGARLLTASVSDGTNTVAWPIEHSEAPNDWGAHVLLDVVLRCRWIVHNANMELKWIEDYARRLGREEQIDAVQPFDDTNAIGRVVKGRSGGLTLDEMSRAILGIDLKAISSLNVKALDTYPLGQVMAYNGLDALACCLIYVLKIREAAGENYQRIIDSIKTTTRMEVVGVPTDQIVAQELTDEWTKKLEDARSAANRVYEVREFTRAYQKEFNIDSEDLATALIEFGKVPLPKAKVGHKTDEETLKALAGDNPLVKHTLAYREASKMMGTYLPSITEAPKRYGGHIIHPGYTVMWTETERLSSTDPNIQNFPARRHKKIRRVIPAPPGTLMFKFDYGQIEARVIGMASKDRALCESILASHDIHWDWLYKVIVVYPEYMRRLEEIAGVKEEKIVLKAGRGAIKTDFVFSSFFGSVASSISRRTGIPVEKVDELHKEFWRTFSGVRDWQEKCRKEYENTGSSRTLTGRIRHQLLNGNEPINTPIQGTAADLMRDAMNELAALSRAEKDPYLHPKISIHDDLSFFLPDSDACSPYIEKILEVMAKVRYNWQIVPLMIEGSCGPDWAHQEEFVVHTGGYAR